MKARQIKARLHLALMQGHRITDAIARRRWRTNRVASYVHRLNKDGFKVLCDRVYAKNGDQYGVYYHPIPQRKSAFA